MNRHDIMNKQLVTPKTRINYHLADKIANGIVEAAFGHEFKAKQKVLIDLSNDLIISQVNNLKALGAYDLLVDMCILNQQKGRFIIEMNDGLKEVLYYDIDSPFTSLAHIKVSEDMQSKILEAKEALRKLEEKLYLLSEELRTQMEGKSVNTIIKLWPQAEPIIKTLFNFQTTEVEVPLESILQRYMTALPAPAEDMPNMSDAATQASKSE